MGKWASENVINESLKNSCIYTLHYMPSLNEVKALRFNEGIVILVDGIGRCTI